MLTTGLFIQTCKSLQQYKYLRTKHGMYSMLCDSATLHSINSGIGLELNYILSLKCSPNTMYSCNATWISKRILHSYVYIRIPSVGPGRLCLKHNLLFYSFISQNVTYYAFQVAYYSRIIPSVCRGSHAQIE